MSRLRGATPEAERPGNLHWPLHGGWPLRSHHVRYGPRTIRWQERDVRDPWAYAVATAPLQDLRRDDYPKKLEYGAHHLRHPCVDYAASAPASHDVRPTT